MSQVISDDVAIYLHISLNVVVRSVISVAGVVTNLINMIIFSKLGLKDSMSVGLFSLSLTDFLVTVIQLASAVTFVMGLLRVNAGVDMEYLGYYSLGWAISGVYQISCWITAMISIERCYCVVSPFKVKAVFTRFRCIVVTLTIYIVYFSMHVPIYTSDRIKWIEIIFLSGNNTTVGISEKSILKKSVNLEIMLVELIVDLTAGVSLWLISQVVIIVCAVWLGYSLEASSRVRRNVRHESKDTNERQHAFNSKDSSTLSNRERRLVKVVMILAVTLTGFNVPKMITTVLYYTFPGVHIGEQGHLSNLLWALAYTFVTLGCSVSFVVYLKLNASFRREFKNILTPFKVNLNRTVINMNTNSMARVCHPDR